MLIVGVSGYGRETDRVKSKASGIDAHLTKPVELEALFEELAKARARRKP